MLPRLLVLCCAVPLVAAAQAPTLSPFAAAKARTLVATRLPCLGCHRFEGIGGKVAPDLTEVSARRSAEYIARIVDDPQGTVPGTPMPRTVMTAELRALVLAMLIRTTSEKVPPHQSPSSPVSIAMRQLDAAILYTRFCAACHGRDGGGDGPNARFLPVHPAIHRDAKMMSTRTNDRLFDAIYAGGYPLGRNTTMPAFGATLTRDEIWSLVRYLRLLCRCRPPVWSTDGAQSTRSAPAR